MTLWIVVVVLCNVVWPLVFFATKRWIQATVDGRVKQKFEEKIEEFRSEIRKSEELLKSTLRSKEADNSALLDALLSGKAQRQVLLDKRRIEAVERLWNAVIALAPYKQISSVMAVMDFAYLSGHSDDENVRNMVKAFTSGEIPKWSADNDPRNEQPFVSSIAWAMFAAYQSIVHSAFLRAKLVETGMRDIDKALDSDRIKRLVLAALPHQSAFIETHDIGAYYYLLEDVENALLLELRKMLEYRDVDETGGEQAARILAIVREADPASSISVDGLAASGRAKS